MEAFRTVSHFGVHPVVLLFRELRRMSRRGGPSFLTAVLDSLKGDLRYFTLQLREHPGHPGSEMSVIPHVWWRSRQG